MGPSSDSQVLRPAGRIRVRPALWIVLVCAVSAPLRALSPVFDLRAVNGTNFVSPVKAQTDGTCWCHGTMAALESNLKITGRWIGAGEPGEPNLAEYHLDWWNGFNQHHNDDIDPPAGGGLAVHQGGDYRVAAAYLARGDGAVYSPAANDGTERDTPWFAAAPARASADYHRYAPRHIEWYALGTGTQGIDTLKTALTLHGALAACMYYGGGFYTSSHNSHYQPPTDPNPPNHSIALVGWDDTRPTAAPSNGAWLCKNSWGSGWGRNGYFWISYYDKHCGRHPEMGAVSFRDVESNAYSGCYTHDLHGWRDTLAVTQAFNAFTARERERLEAVRFYTTLDSAEFTARVFGRFEGGQLLDLRSVQTGRFERPGLHTVTLDTPVNLAPGQPFYIALDVSGGGQAFDRTSTVDVLLDPPAAAPYDRAFFESLGKMDILQGTEVVSRAEPGQSYYRSGGAWLDLTDANSTANFCIQGLTRPRAPDSGTLFRIR